jgi:hypothetical protein
MAARLRGSGSRSVGISQKPRQLSAIRHCSSPSVSFSLKIIASIEQPEVIKKILDH